MSDKLAPRFVARAAFSPRRFRVGGRSVLTYSLSEPAAVTIAFQRKASGRRVGRSCRAPSSKNRGKRRCTRYVTVGTLKRQGLQGANSVPFTGRIGRRALKPGSYRALTTAKDAAGNVSKASTASFTILS